MRDADNERHACQRALDAALQRHHRHRRMIVFPKQHVMLEEDRIALSKINLSHRHYLSLDLASAQSEVNLGHVADTRRLAPARFADQILNVQRRTASPT